MRIVEKDGIHWFVAKDICKYFGDSDHKRSISRLDKDEISLAKSQGFSWAYAKMQQWSMSRDFIISCSTSSLNRHVARMGGARIAPQIKERVEKIRKFKRWVTHEVLPSIRKTGAYLSPGMSNEQVKALVATLEEEVYRRIQAENRLAKLEAHAEKLARAAIPATPFGELSQKTGRPRTCLVRNYLRSGQEVKPEHFGAYIQLLLPLYTARELLLDALPAPTSAPAASVSC
ncbi:MAG: hypothetical protein L6W00_09630 [Lentisphaeria bacterium]|nr:MAG: hypothetical protein L6W00_09630 [Lentisphaeria bacterium]